MIGEKSSEQRTEGTLSARTTLGRAYRATSVQMKRNLRIFLMESTDDSWDGNSLGFHIYNGMNGGKDLDITLKGDVQATFRVWVGGGFYRLDFVDRGKITYFFDLLTHEMKGTFHFEVDDQQGNLAYRFTDGTFSARGLEPF